MRVERRRCIDEMATIGQPGGPEMIDLATAALEAGHLDRRSTVCGDAEDANIGLRKQDRSVAVPRRHVDDGRRADDTRRSSGDRNLLQLTLARREEADPLTVR